ncbi:MAG: phage tail sheath C-terminal domain-containing protein [Raoultibacter sp.]
MALGGGNWLSQNKKLPGSYINFVSVGTSGATLSDRGVGALGLALDWGIDGEVFTVTNANFQKNSLKLFGYAYTDAALTGLRDFFAGGAHTLHAYKLNSAATGKASNAFGAAKHAGSRGNSITIKIAANADDSSKWDVTTIFDNVTVDVQTVAAATALVDNDYVDFDSTATLAATAGTPMTGGVSATVTAANHQTCIEKLEPFAFNAIGIISDERTQGAPALNALYGAFARRMRDEQGVKFQAVCFRYAGDYEGIVNVENVVSDTGVSAASLVYWVTGVVAATAVNRSALNRKYDGEFTVDVDCTQSQLEACIDSGKFTLHRVGADIRVLADINSLVTTTATKNDLFKENQTIRVIDAIANDIANMFNGKYLGQIPNNNAGRISLWTDIVKYHRDLERIGAIENFDESVVKVDQGDTKRSVVVNEAITVVNAMGQLYMTCIVA